MKDSTAIIIALIGIVVPATGAYLAFYDKRHPVETSSATQAGAEAGTAAAPGYARTDGDAARSVRTGATPAHVDRPLPSGDNGSDR